MGRNSDIAIAGRAMKERAKALKASRIETALLEANSDGIEWTLHTKWHWSYNIGKNMLNYWPSTGKWRYIGRGYCGKHSDVVNFIKKRENDDRYGEL